MAESTRIKVTEIMERLDLGEQTIYAMLEAKEAISELNWANARAKDRSRFKG